MLLLDDLDHTGGHVARGGQLSAAEKYGEAVASLNKATEQNPKAGPAYNMLGYAHLFQGEAGPAVGDAESARAVFELPAAVE